MKTIGDLIDDLEDVRAALWNVNRRLTVMEIEKFTQVIIETKRFLHDLEKHVGEGPAR